MTRNCLSLRKFTLEGGRFSHDPGATRILVLHLGQDPEFLVCGENRLVSLQLQPAVVGIDLADSCHCAAGRGENLASREHLQ